MAPKAKEKAKPSPAPAAAATPPSVPIEDLFTNLHRHVQRSEYQQAVKVADQVLAIAPGDEDAVRCKVVALIRSDEFHKALDTIRAHEDGQVDLSFYKAYCLYRQNKLHEALRALDGQERSTNLLQLESQILYRLGRHDACVESTQRLKIDSLDMKTNVIAALVAAGRSSEVQKTIDILKVKASGSFELAYNIACSLIERKRYAEAEQQLLLAQRDGHEMLMNEDYPEEEIEAELAPIAVQLAYVRQLLGQTQEATEAYTSTINRNIADASSLAVAINNLIALRARKDASDSLKKLDRLIEKSADTKNFQLANGLDFKFSSRQKEAIYSNYLLLLLHANKIDQAKELVSFLLEQFPDSFTPVLLQASILVREKKISKAEEILAQHADKFPEKSKPVLLARAQISAAVGHFQIAADSLSKISDIQNMPATVATVVSLRERSSDICGASAVLDSAIQWWKNTMTEENKLDVIMREAASFKLSHGQQEEASRIYEELVKSHGSVEALVGLVMTAAHSDPGKAETYEKRLRPLSGLKVINVESLEKTSGAKHVEGVHTKADTSEDVKKAKTKKRKRKPRYPKGFDPANPGPPPDPERWLPKRERSSYRPKRKDKRAVRGSQGAVVREKQDASAAATAAASSSKGASGNTSSEQPRSSSNKPPPKTSNKSRKKSRS